MFWLREKNLVAELAREMPGTTGQGGYFLLLATSLGRLGVKLLGGAVYRIRVEPASAGTSKTLAPMLIPQAGWKQPGWESNTFRFSIVTDGDVATTSAILSALRALRHKSGR